MTSCLDVLSTAQNLTREMRHREVMNRSVQTYKRLNRRVRVAFMTKDSVGTHPISTFAFGLIQEMDRKRYEVILLDNNPAETHRNQDFLKLFDRAHVIHKVPTKECVDMLAGLNVDVLVDLGGHTADDRFDVSLASTSRAVLSYLGYPGLTAVPGIRQVSDVFCGNGRYLALHA